MVHTHPWVVASRFSTADAKHQFISGTSSVAYSLGIDHNAPSARPEHARSLPRLPCVFQVHHVSAMCLKKPHVSDQITCRQRFVTTALPICGLYHPWQSLQQIGHEGGGGRVDGVGGGMAVSESGGGHVAVGVVQGAGSLALPTAPPAPICHFFMGGWLCTSCPPDVSRTRPQRATNPPPQGHHCAGRGFCSGTAGRSGFVIGLRSSPRPLEASSLVSFVMDETHAMERFAGQASR